MCRTRISPTRRYNQDFLDRLALAPWVRWVYLIAEPEPCAACAGVAGPYDVSGLPALPSSRCTKRREGCSCWFVALPSAGHEQLRAPTESSAPDQAA